MPNHAAGWHGWTGGGVSGGANSLVVDANYRSEMAELLARVRRWDTAAEPWLAEFEATITLLDAIFRAARTGQMARL